MRSITRYILRQLVAATLAITVALTFAVWLTQSLRFLDFIVNRGLPASTFFSFVVLLMPSFLGVVLPIAVFSATLFVYNKLGNDSELMVMRAAGFSPLQLARPAILIGLIAMAIAYSITLYLQPVSFRAFKDLQHQIRHNYSTVLLQEGVFNTVAKGITIYVRERTAEGELQGILVHDERVAEKPVTMMAERGALVRSDEGPRVVMVKGNRQEILQDNGNLSFLYFDRYTIELSSFQEDAPFRWREPKERFLWELFAAPKNPTDERFRKELIGEGHQRLVGPLYSLTFVLIGLAVLFSGEFNRRGQTRRILLAIFVVGAMEAVALSLHDMSSRTLYAIGGMYAAVLLPLAVALMALGGRLRRPRVGPSLDREGAPA